MLDLAARDHYFRFLLAQYLARRPIEQWCAANCPPALAPPAVSELIVGDLAALGFAAPTGMQPFALPANADAIGLVWALGGSSLGNRAMLAHLRRKAPSGWPAGFLSDERMPAFWKALAPQLALPDPDPGPAVAAARAVFRHFSAAADTVLQEAAA